MRPGCCQILGWVLLAALYAGASGCGGSSTASSDGPLIYARAADAETLDPINTDMGETVKVLVNLYDTLVAYDDETAELVPSLAEKWEVSADGRTWTFHLRPGVLFHDDTPCDAEAVVTNFERLLADKHELLFDAKRPYQPSFLNIAGIQAQGPGTIVFTLKEPSAVFLQNLAMFPASIASPTALRKYGKDFSTHPVGTGPFKLASWARDQQIVLSANEKYWGGPPQSERVVFIPVAENAVRAEQVRRGHAHIADELSPAEIEGLRKAPGVVIQTQPGLNVGYLSLQTEKPPLNDVQVREAIALAIDKQRLIAGPYLGQGEPAVNMVPRTMWGHNNEIQDRPFDPAKAKELLAEAAARDGFQLPLKLKLYMMAKSRPYMPQPRETALFIRDALEPIGIQLEIIVSENNLHFEKLSRGEHDLALAGWSSDNNDPDNFLYPLLDLDNISDVGNNNSQYRSEPVHKLLIAAQHELDRAKREQLYHEAQRLIFADVPTVPLVHTSVSIALRDNVEGYKLHPTGMVRLKRASLASPAP